MDDNEPSDGQCELFAFPLVDNARVMLSDGVKMNAHHYSCYFR